MHYLLDTNAVSEFRRKTKMDTGFARWAQSVPATQFAISVLTLLEIETGFHRLNRRDPVQAALLRRWIDTFVTPTFSGATYPVTDTIVMRCAPLHIPDPRPALDSLIAATALVHGLAVVTRNEHHFASLGVAIINPWTT